MEYLKRTPGSAGNRKTFTLSTWMKRGILSQSSGTQNIFEGRPGGGEYLIIGLTNAGNATGGDTFRIEGSVPSGTAMNLGIDRFFRDAGAWYHLVFAFDTTQATAENRAKFYVNGEQTGLNSTYTTYPSQDADFYWNNTQVMAVGGSDYSAGEGFDGYLAETYNIDGLQLTPSSFGETDSTTGIWIPKTYSGAYGTNGFRLQYKNSAALGTDTSGQGNNFTPQNMSADNQVTDTPDNNFCTLNPLQKTASIDLTEGNTKGTNTQNDQGAAGTMAFNTGKWYWEVKLLNQVEVGINLDSDILQLSNDATIGSNDSNIKQTALITNNAGGSNDFRFNGSTETVTSTACSNDDILMIAVDADNTKIYFGKNGTWMNSGDPAGGTGELKNFSSGYTAGNFITPTFTNGISASAKCEFNFGNPSFTIASANSDANGLGNFEYAVPSGYYALCTKNLNTYG